VLLTIVSAVGDIEQAGERKEQGWREGRKAERSTDCAGLKLGTLGKEDSEGVRIEPKGPPHTPHALHRPWSTLGLLALYSFLRSPRGLGLGAWGREQGNANCKPQTSTTY
jgi:hypothetical protein